MSTATRRVLAMSLATALMLALVWLFVSNEQAGATTTNQTCKDVGFQNLEASTSGPWGSIVFDDTSPILDLTVAAGYEVRLCIKAGSANQDLGPEVSDWLDEGSYSMTHSSGKDLSHYGVLYRQTTTTTTQPEETTTSADTTTTTTPSTSSTTTSTPTTSTTPTTLPSSTTTTTPGTDSTTSTMPAPTTSAPTGPSTSSPDQPEVLPFTGVEDWLAPIAGLLLVSGLAALSIAGRKEDLD